MNAQLQTDKRLGKYSDLDRYCHEWAKWVNTDRLFRELGHPRSCISPSIYDASMDTEWRARQKTTRTTNVRLPDWKCETTMDEIIQSLVPELRRVVYCRYEAKVRSDQLFELRIQVRKMHLYGRDGRYTWPRFRQDRIDALGMPSRTFDRTLQWAREAIMSHPKYTTRNLI